MTYLFPEKPLKEPIPQPDIDNQNSFLLPESVANMLSSIHLEDDNQENQIPPSKNIFTQSEFETCPIILLAENPKPKEKEFILRNDEEFPWHLMTPADILQELMSNLMGLSTAEHQELLKKHGPNKITPTKQMHWIFKFLLHLLGGFQLFLWAGFILCVVAFGITGVSDYQTLALGLICLIVILVTGIFDSIQEGKSDKLMAALKSLTPEKVFVIRNNLLDEVDAQTLVPGDICNVKAGEKAPADLRILQCSDLKVNNENLTGENVDIKLEIEALNENIYEAKNIARMGCHFTAGHGIGIVFATGDHTFFGNIATRTVSIKRPVSFLHNELKRMVTIM